MSTCSVTSYISWIFWFLWCFCVSSLSDWPVLHLVSPVVMTLQTLLLLELVNSCIISLEYVMSRWLKGFYVSSHNTLFCAKSSSNYFHPHRSITSSPSLWQTPSYWLWIETVTFVGVWSVSSSCKSGLRSVVMCSLLQTVITQTSCWRHLMFKSHLSCFRCSAECCKWRRVCVNCSFKSF